MSTSSRTPSLTPSRSPSPQPPVQPDHFYGTEGNPLPPSPRSDGKTWLDPAEDPLAMRGIPVFKPTMEEFQDFEGYMNRIEPWGARSGIVKVIPPKEWKDSLPALNDKLADVRLNHPIEQHMLGRTGLFRAQNMEKQRNMSVREWAELCNHPDMRAPGVDDFALHHASRPDAPRGRRGRKKAEKADTPADDAVIKVEDDAQASLASPPHTISTPITPARQLDGSVDPDQPSTPPEDPKEEEEEDKPKAKGKRKGLTRAEKEARLAERASKDGAFLETFDPDSDWLPDNTTPFDYTPEFCHELERKFWRTCGFGKPAWYGADMAGSLFTDATTAWNVAHLPSLLKRIIPKSREHLPGVNTPYLYFGMWRATFAWHVEDMDLFSINYIHFGAGKFWYAIPQQRAGPFENIMRGFFPESRCPQFLRHKSFLASPDVLKKFSCKPNTLVQQAGEFVITYPRGYHAGFNLGFNCAESVNFALDSWLELGRKAKACNCVSDSVRIDVDGMLQECERERLAEALGVSLETQDSVGETAPQVEAAVPEAKPKAKPRGSRKRKSDELEAVAKPAKTKKAKTTPPASASASASSPTRPPVASGSGPSKTTAGSSTKRSLILKLGLKPQESFPCCLCVSPSREGLLPVREPPRTQNPAYNDVKEWMAHEHCASVVPETWVDEVEGPGVLLEDGSIVKQMAVFGVDAIVKDRWNLRCSACTKHRAKTHGAPVQCTKGKCPKAFHVSCAREADDVSYAIVRNVEKEVVICDPEEDKPAPMDVDGGATTYRPPYRTVQKLEISLLCPQHNPSVIEAKKASKQDRLRQDLLALPPNARIKIRGSSGVFEVSLVRVLEDKKAVEVIWDRGLKREFKWGSIVTGDMEGKEVIQKPAEAAVAPVGQAATTYPSFSLSLAASAPGPSSSAPMMPLPSTSLPNPHVPPSQYIQYQPRASGQYPLAPKPPLGAWASYGTYAVPVVPYPPSATTAPNGAQYDYGATNAYVQAYAQARAQGLYPCPGYAGQPSPPLPPPLQQGQAQTQVQGYGGGWGQQGQGQKGYTGIQWKQPYTGPREKSESHGGSRASSVAAPAPASTPAPAPVAAAEQEERDETMPGPVSVVVPVPSGAVGVVDAGTVDPVLAGV
ncbi:JmjC domain, hydroxylase-domain-containing protein [Amylostereum chailletii]|nr:JmjC domain, hydroxylase-domain-containing protein [Amylostereum chailletii]